LNNQLTDIQRYFVKYNTSVFYKELGGQVSKQTIRKMIKSLKKVKTMDEMYFLKSIIYNFTNEKLAIAKDDRDLLYRKWEKTRKTGLEKSSINEYENYCWVEDWLENGNLRRFY